MNTGLRACTLGMMIGAGMPFPVPMQAQPLAVDPTYSPRVIGRLFVVPDLTVLSAGDDRFIVRGDFEFVGDHPAPGLARVFADGSADSGFAFAGTRLNYQDQLTVLADGSIVIARARETSDVPAEHERLVRYLSDGSIPAQHPSLAITGGGVGILTATSDGRLIVAGTFTHIAGIACGGFARINGDGTVDAGFLPFAATPGVKVSAVLAANDGAIFILGDRPDAVEGTDIVARIDADGALVPAFTYPQSTHPLPDKLLAAFPDGSVLVRTGAITGANLLRVQTDGTATPFAVGVAANYYISDAQAAGVHGFLCNASARNYSAGERTVIQIDHDGILVRDFRDVLPSGEAVKLVATSDGDDAIVLQGEWYQPYVPPGVYTIIAVTPRMIDPKFSRLSTATGEVAPWLVDVGDSMWVSRIEPSAAGGLFVSGHFHRFGGVERPGIVHLRANGEVDPEFAPENTYEPYLLVAEEPGGTVLVQHQIDRVTSDQTRPVLRLNARGEIDPSLPADSELRQRDVIALGVAPDGRILVSLFEPNHDHEENLHLVWYHPDGTRERTLPTVFGGLPKRRYGGETTYSNEVSDAIQAGSPVPGGGILITGTFNRVNGIDVPGLVRLHADGSVDTDYQANLDALLRTPILPPGAEPVRYSFSLLNGGRVLVTSWRHLADPSVIRSRLLLPDGTVDETMLLEEGHYLSGIREQLDGSYFSHQPSTLVRFLADGTRDLNVAVPFVSDASIPWTMPDGTVYVGGATTPQRREQGFRFLRLHRVPSPGITVQPMDASGYLFRHAILQVAIGDATPATYQWQFEGQDIPGATQSRLVVPSLGRGDVGSYRVMVTVGSTTYVSETATVSLRVSHAFLANFSARSRVRPGHAPQIAGFIVDTANPHPVLLRAIGRGLPWDQPEQTLPQPSLALFAGEEETHRDMGGALDEEIIAIAHRVGAFGPIRNWDLFLGPEFTNYDAALSPSLGAGIFTAQTTSRDERDGISLFEFYDAAETPEPGFVRNISLRGHTAPGVDTMIGGFVVSGDGPLPLLLRVIGGELAAWNVADVLANPALTLFGASGTTIVANDNWSEQPVDRVQAVRAATLATGAFDLAPDSTSAAVVVALDPGAYTVHATGGSAAGEVLLEIYVVEE